MVIMISSDYVIYYNKLIDYYRLWLPHAWHKYFRSSSNGNNNNNNNNNIIILPLSLVLIYSDVKCIKGNFTIWINTIVLKEILHIIIIKI